MAEIEPIELAEVSHLSSLRVTMFKRVYDLNPAEDLALSVSDLGSHLQSQPSKYAFYASLKDLATTKLEKLNSKLHRTRAIEDGKIRADGILPDGNKITEDSLRRYLNTIDAVIDVEKEIHSAQTELAILSSIVRAFEHRRECLVVLANRQNSGVFHDKDVNTTVHASITPLQKLQEATEGVGAYTGKKPAKK